MPKEYGIINPPAVVAPAVVAQTQFAPSFKMVRDGLEAMIKYHRTGRHDEFGKQIPAWEKNEESYDTLRVKDQTVTKLERLLQSIEKTIPQVELFDARKTDAMAQAISAQVEAAVEAANV